MHLLVIAVGICRSARIVGIMIWLNIIFASNNEDHFVQAWVWSTHGWAEAGIQVHVCGKSAKAQGLSGARSQRSLVGESKEHGIVAVWGGGHVFLIRHRGGEARNGWICGVRNWLRGLKGGGGNQ